MSPKGQEHQIAKDYLIDLDPIIDQGCKIVQEFRSVKVLIEAGPPIDLIKLKIVLVITADQEPQLGLEGQIAAEVKTDLERACQTGLLMDLFVLIIAQEFHLG